MRTLTGVSRLFLLAAISVAALLILCGAYYIGYVGQLQRELSGPGSVSERVGARIATIEHSLGHNGFLKSYRAYWLGDAAAHTDLVGRAREAARAANELTKLEGGAAAAREVEAIVNVFSQTAELAPEAPPSGLRGVSDDATKVLPSAAQLETNYLSLTAALDRLSETERATTLQALGLMLDRSQAIILIVLVLLTGGLIGGAWLMRSRVIHPLQVLERSLSGAAEGALGPRIWGTERRDEIGSLARAGEALRRNLSELPALKTMASQGEVHLTLDGPGAVVFEKLTAQVNAAADALQIASGKASATQRIEIKAAIAQLSQASNEVRTAANALRGDFSQIIENVRASSQTLASAAAEGAHRVDEVAGRFVHGGDELAHIAARANERIGAMLAELSATAQGLRQASEASEAAQVSDTMRTAISGDLRAITDTVNSAADKVRDEVTRLIAHLGEERLLPAREGVQPVALLEGPAEGATSKTLADVPKDEVLQRLGSLAAEMHAVNTGGPGPDQIRAELIEVAEEMRQLGNAPETRRANDELGSTLSRHADAIEIYAREAAPGAELLRDTLSSMARELRQVTARARNGLASEAAQHAANAAADIEERAQRLFGQLEAVMGAGENDDVSFETTNSDVELLANLAARLEARAEVLSEQAVSKRFDELKGTGSAAEQQERAFVADMRTDHAIQTVFESIERLNNVAAALARAGDAERQRRIAS
ncbi:MAG: HAMP domain-containing protein [Alphaproteobacteria bacterium]|nr:HAMP domain-containing protein [Alphaproteobacteria bacterium]